MKRTIFARLALPGARLGSTLACSLALVCLVAASGPALAEPPPPPSPAQPAAATEHVGLQSPAQRSTRYSAYALPKGIWQLDVGALGVNSGELFGQLGVARGFGHGLQLDFNLLHWSVGLFGFEGRWAFLDTRYLGLSVGTGMVYGHGSWIWILDDRAQKILSDSDLLVFTVGTTASAPLTRWLQLDLGVQYQHAELYGSIGGGESFYAESQIGARQLFLRPTVRLFASDRTAFELNFKLPALTRVPLSLDSTISIGEQEGGGARATYYEVEFAETWNLELGVRSRLQPWLYGTVRLHYGQVSQTVYGASLYPSFGLEFRL